MPLTAIGFTLLCNLLYAGGYALAKLLSASLDPVQITALRCALVLGAGVGVGLTRPDPTGVFLRAISPPMAWAQRAAAAVLIGSTLLAVFAYALLPVTEAAALGFTAPLITVVLGALVLKEKIAPRRWLAIACGFVGMLLIIRPGSEVFRREALIPIAAALSYAWYQVQSRQLRGAANATDGVVQAAIMGVVVLGPMLLWLWRPFGWEVAGLLVLFTAFQTGGLAALAAAVRRAEVSALAPWNYSRLLFALAMDAAVFGRFPGPLALGGAALIAGGGMLLLHVKQR
ncbi:EamA-like transporter family protein [Humitalea rosea]|uniref:EamA-like transporter family protein n=1 Tax=Humitalea rosea TaxID=990373 RepID=A0A2W7IMV8_9PROT|nr:DMT family transporter [Humitalea rosea]PZW46604.1 EamA-like transporter family protein [Humitalea rosea]